MTSFSLGSFAASTLRLALICTFVLSTNAAYSLDAPPSPPSYDKPSFEGEREPESEHRAPGSREEPEPRKPRVPRNQVKPEVDIVRCIEKDGHLQAAFTPGINKQGIREGRKFCKYTGAKPNAVVRCVNDQGKRRIEVLPGLSAKSRKWAKNFCMCAWGLA